MKAVCGESIFMDDRYRRGWHVESYVVIGPLVYAERTDSMPRLAIILEHEPYTKGERS